ncbi:MAG: hypothetical protein AAFY28_12700 [Actinomycetota bacterium]
MTARLIVHLGPHKTATSLFQAALFGAADDLTRADIHLASTGRRGNGHHDLAAALMQGDRAINADTAGRQLAGWSELRTELDALDDRSTLIVTSENFSQVGDAEVAAIEPLLADVDVTILCGLRDPVALVPSLWQEGIKWSRQWSLDEAAPLLLGDDRVQLFPVLGRWRAAAGATNVGAVVVPGHGSASALDGLAAALEVDRATFESWSSGVANPSLSWVHAEAIRAVSTAMDPTDSRDTLVERQRMAQSFAGYPLTELDATPPSLTADTAAAAQHQRTRLIERIGPSDVTLHGDLTMLAADARAPATPPGDDAIAAALEQLAAHDRSAGACHVTAIDAARSQLAAHPPRRSLLGRLRRR